MELAKSSCTKNSEFSVSRIQHPRISSCTNPFLFAQLNLDCLHCKVVRNFELQYNNPKQHMQEKSSKQAHWQISVALSSLKQKTSIMNIDLETLNYCDQNQHKWSHIKKLLPSSNIFRSHHVLSWKILEMVKMELLKTKRSSYHWAIPRALQNPCLCSYNDHKPSNGQ